MRLTLKEVDVQAERVQLLEMLGREFERWHDGVLYDWAYIDNPSGPARTWTLNDENGDMVGVSSAFPRRLSVDGRQTDAWVLADFAIDRGYRSLGPALMLQRCVKEAVDRGEIDVWYDFPSRAMMAVYQRLGVHRYGELVRLVRPLRADGVISERLGESVVGRGVTALGNAVLASGVTRTRRDRSWRIGPLTGDLDSALVPVVPFQKAVCVDKSLAYLRWRYIDVPTKDIWIVQAERNGEAGGFLVCHGADEAVTILDVFGIQEDAALRELVLAVLEVALERPARKVTAAISSEHPLRPQFEQLGFHARDSAPFVVYARPGLDVQSVPWLLMGGDRD